MRVAAVLLAVMFPAAPRGVTDPRTFIFDTLPVLERRLNDAITGVASIIIGAWEQAGRPALPAEMPRTPRRVPRPNQ